MENQAHKRFRFDLSDLFALTTAVALTLLLARLPLLLVENSAPTGQIHFAMTITAMALGATAGALGKRKRRFALYAGGAYLLVALPSTWLQPPNALGWTFIVIVLIVLGAQAVLLRVLRPE